MKRLFKDLFYGPGNKHLDLGRVIAFLSFLPLFAAAVYNMRLGQSLDIMALGGGPPLPGPCAGGAFSSATTSASSRRSGGPLKVTGTD